jgi:hypothetical protein
MAINKIIATVTILIAICSIAQAQPSSSQNYIVTNTIKQAGITTVSEVNNLPVAVQGKSQTVVYFDGLGRQIQTVITQGSAGGKDIVSAIVYDSMGREAKKYLPYVESGPANGYGSYQPGWLAKQSAFYTGGLQGVDTSNAPYSQTVFEASPLNRILAQGAPGSPWQPNLTDPYDTGRKVVKMKYETNKVNDSVRLFTVDSAGNISSPGIYAARQLSIFTRIDEHNAVVKKYTDKSGQLLLKRVFIHNDSLQTYYVYDDFGLLRVVIQPEGVAAITGSTWASSSGFLDKWAFIYRYDARKRQVMKKTPGADSVVMIYDNWDRLVLNQD